MSDEPFDLEKLRSDAEIVEDGFWRKLRRNIGRIPFADDAVAAYYCAMDPRTPTKAKAVIFGALVYFITPTDVIPDILIPGFTDDAAIFAAALTMARAYMTKEHYAKARAFLDQPEPAGTDS
ncbi:MAG: YkvA family protein [Rhodospirillales bacterium]